LNKENLQYRKGKRRVIIRLEIAEERERDALQQRCRDKREAAAAANKALKARKREREEEQDLVKAAWVANTRL
jgi:hypothetical protein